MVLYPNKLPESERVCSGICNWDRGDGVFDRKNLQVYDELEYNGLMEGIK